MTEVTIKSGSEMMKALAPKGKLYGLTEQLPEGFNINEAGYPQTFIIDEENKTFTVKQTETKTETTTSTSTSTSSSKKGLSKGAIAGIVCGVIAGVAIIVGVVLACVL